MDWFLTEKNSKDFCVINSFVSWTLVTFKLHISPQVWYLLISHQPNTVIQTDDKQLYSV